MYFRSDNRYQTDADRAKRLQQQVEAQDGLRQQMEAKRMRKVHPAEQLVIIIQ